MVTAWRTSKGVNVAYAIIYSGKRDLDTKEASGNIRQGIQFRHVFLMREWGKRITEQWTASTYVASDLFP